MHLFDILINSDNIALIIKDDEFSFEDLRNSSLSIASQLHNSNIKKGDRVLISATPSFETVSSIYGCARAGVIFIPIAPVISRRRLSSIIKNSEPVAILDDQNRFAYLSNKIQNLKPDLDIKDHHLPEEPAGSDIASIIYTSGSTGDPKGVTMTHDNMIFAANSIKTYLNMKESDVILNCLPLSFDYGLYQVLLTGLSKATLILEPSFIYLNNLLKIIDEKKVTGWPIVPAILELLFKMGKGDNSLISLEFITNTAQAIPVETIKRFRKEFPSTKIYSMYGLTESKRTLYLDPGKIDMKPGSVGNAIPGTEVFLLDNNKKIITEPGKKGVLVARGPHVMVGYWNNKEDTEKRIMEHDELGRILITDDVFEFDEEGDLYFKGRGDDLVKIGGEKASPFEVESVINEVQGVTDSIVYPVKDRIMGNCFHCLVTGENISLKEVEIHCRRTLERYLIPKKFDIVDTFPLLTNGKIDRKKAISENRGEGNE